MNRIESILRQNGPMLAGELAKAYEEKYNASNDAARKAISRAGLPVQKLKKFPFEKNQAFCYLKEHYNTTIYKNTLYCLLKRHSATIAPFLIALENHYGIISKDLLPIYSGSPIKNTKGHRLFARNVQDLLAAGIILEYDDERYMLNDSFSGIFMDISRYHSYHSYHRLCKIIANDFVSWAAKLNIIAFHSATVYPDVAEFSHFQWSITCPSYMQPIYNCVEGKPGFLVADVIFKPQASVDDVAYFIEKVNVVRHFKNAPNFLPVLLISSVSPEALRLLKEHKVFIGILSNLYDNSYTTTLFEIYHVFQNATAILLNDVTKIDALLENIAKNEGRFHNVMGDLFEYMVGAFYRKRGVEYLEMNKFIPNEKGTRNELDILICKDNKVIAIECKATKSPLSYEYVHKWLSEIVPVFRRWIQTTYPSREYEFQIWSLGGYDEAALELLKEHQKTVGIYTLFYYAKPEILNEAKKYNDHTFLEHIRKHFADY